MFGALYFGETPFATLPALGAPTPPIPQVAMHTGFVAPRQLTATVSPKQ